MFLFAVSPNRCCNHDLNVKLLVSVWKAMVAKTIQGNPGISEEEASKKTKSVWLLDCWPVNLYVELKEEIAEKCPGIEFLYIPAGAMG